PPTPGSEHPPDGRSSAACPHLSRQQPRRRRLNPKRSSSHDPVATPPACNCPTLIFHALRHSPSLRLASPHPHPPSRPANPHHGHPQRHTRLLLRRRPLLLPPAPPRTRPRPGPPPPPPGPPHPPHRRPPHPPHHHPPPPLR